MSAGKEFLYKLLPWGFITSYARGVVVQKDGILQKTFAYRAPDIDCVGAYEVNGIAVRVNEFTKRLGSGWAFFIEARRYSSREYPALSTYHGGGFDRLAPYLIDREREDAFTAAGRHYETSYYITFVWKPPSETIKTLARLFVQSAASYSDDKTGIKENARWFSDECRVIASYLRNDMLIEELNGAETAAYLHSAVSLNREPPHLPHNQIFLDRILPDMPLENSLTMKLGNYYIPIIGVNDFPDETYPAMLDSLNRARLEYRWVTRWICQSKEDALKEARKIEKAHRGNRKSFLQTFIESTSKDGAAGSEASINHGADVKAADAVGAAIEIETDEASLGYSTANVMVWDKDYGEAKKKADMVRNIINSAGFTCKEETFNALEAWRSMMPGDVYSNFRALPVMSYNESCVLPLSSVWAGTHTNAHAGKVSGVSLPHLVCATAEGTPFFMNINPTDVGHTAIFGPTGAGKSTLLNLLEAQFLKYPASQIVVFDKGRSCRAVCLACGGLFYEPAAENIAGTAFQPLRDLENERFLMDAQDFIESLLTAKDYKVPPPMQTAIKECLLLLSGMPQAARTLTSFVQYVNYIDPETNKPVLKDYLAAYLWAGKYGKIFDSSVSALSTDTRFLAVEMEELMNRGEDCIVPALVYLFNLVERKFDGKKLSMLILDEAWLFLKNEIFADKIAEWLKVLRKKNVFVVFATQDVADVEKSPLKTTIIQQCLTKIYLADPSAATNAMSYIYSSFGLTESEISLIAAAQMKRDYFYTSPLGRRLFRLDLGSVTLALTGSPDHTLLDELLLENGAGFPLCTGYLDRMGVEYQRLCRPDAPRDEDFIPSSAPPEFGLPAAPPVEIPATASRAAAVLDALERQKEGRRKKGEGDVLSTLAEQFGLPRITIVRLKYILKSNNKSIIEKTRSGELSANSAYGLLKKLSADAESGAAEDGGADQNVA